MNKKSYGTIVKQSKSKKEFLDNVLEHFPRDAVLHHEKIETFADKYYAEETPAYTSPFSHEDFPNALYEMNEWVRETLSMPRPNPMVK